MCIWVHLKKYRNLGGREKTHTTRSLRSSLHGKPVKCAPAQATRWILNFIRVPMRSCMARDSSPARVTLTRHAVKNLQPIPEQHLGLQELLCIPLALTLWKMNYCASLGGSADTSSKTWAPGRQEHAATWQHKRSDPRRQASTVSWYISIEGDYFILSLTLSATSVYKSCCSSRLSKAKRTEWNGKVGVFLFCWISDLDFTPKMPDSFPLSKSEE